MPERDERRPKGKSEARRRDPGRRVRHPEIEHVKAGSTGARSPSRRSRSASAARRVGEGRRQKGGAGTDAAQDHRSEAGAKGAKKTVSRRAPRRRRRADDEGQLSRLARGALAAGEVGGSKRTVAERFARPQGGAPKGSEERSAAAEQAAKTRDKKAPAKKAAARSLLSRDSSRSHRSLLAGVTETRGRGRLSRSERLTQRSGRPERRIPARRAASRPRPVRGAPRQRRISFSGSDRLPGYGAVESANPARPWSSRALVYCHS